MNKEIIAESSHETMSSSQLAEMLGYEKKEVNKKIRAMFGDLVAREKFSPTLRGNGQIDFYNLPELESKMFVAKHNIEYLEMITRFWIDRAKPAKPNWLSNLSKEAVIAIEDLSDQLKESHREVERLQGVCNTITAQFTDGLTTSTLCKSFNGVNIQQVNNTLLAMGLLVKTKYGFEPSSYSRDNYLKVKYSEYNNHKKAIVSLTLKGAKWLYRAYLSGKLPMKKNWSGEFTHVEFEVK